MANLHGSRPCQGYHRLLCDRALPRGGQRGTRKTENDKGHPHEKDVSCCVVALFANGGFGQLTFSPLTPGGPAAPRSPGMPPGPWCPAAPAAPTTPGSP